jgi:hypothetical protein
MSTVVGKVMAREKIRVARSLPDLPLIDEAFSTGKISYSKVRAMTHVANPENEAFVVTDSRVRHREPPRVSCQEIPVLQTAAGMATEDFQTDRASDLTHLTESYLSGSRVDNTRSR